MKCRANQDPDVFEVIEKADLLIKRLLSNFATKTFPTCGDCQYLKGEDPPVCLYLRMVLEDDDDFGCTKWEGRR